MSYTVQIRPQAETDIEEAALWYEEQQQGLGSRYLNEVPHKPSLCLNHQRYPAIQAHAI